MLLISLTITTLGYAAIAVALTICNFVWPATASLMAGLAEANIVTAQSAIAEVSLQFSASSVAAPCSGTSGRNGSAIRRCRRRIAAILVKLSLIVLGAIAIVALRSTHGSRPAGENLQHLFRNHQQR